MDSIYESLTELEKTGLTLRDFFNSHDSHSLKSAYVRLNPSAAVNLRRRWRYGILWQRWDYRLIRKAIFLTIIFPACWNCAQTTTLYTVADILFYWFDELKREYQLGAVAALPGGLPMRACAAACSL